MNVEGLSVAASADRALITSLNKKTVTTQLTISLNKEIELKAKSYNMTKSAFIRALLENISDENLYSKILGPCPH